MGLTSAIIVGAMVLFLELFSYKWGKNVFDKIFPQRQHFISRLVVAFLAGFFFFILFHPTVAVSSKITVMVSCVLLIYANIAFSEPPQ